MEPVDVDVDVDDKAEWSTRNDVIFIRILHEHLKSKFNRLRKKYREFSDLIAHTGFGWDSISNTVTTPEAVWAEHIKSASSETILEERAGDDDDDDGGGGVELTEDSNKKKGKMARRSISSSNNRRKNK
ncbi:hypothetical protein Dsin_032817 [Dipteronia sinensis]|uniref:Myb/SANT-like domain-containing protein n=1 Tax=Dipteronia sinensis TaxID=43782 RepID=A0AAE0DL42_9ROSI|nr:hypothetical protein Dsin_032817 [Dipteronia sinensis]